MILMRLRVHQNMEKIIVLISMLSLRKFLKCVKVKVSLLNPLNNKSVKIIFRNKSFNIIK